MQDQSWVVFVRILIKMINSFSVETAGPPFDAMYHIVLVKE
jgi:hypothetical protein